MAEASQPMPNSSLRKQMDRALILRVMAAPEVFKNSQTRKSELERMAKTETLYKRDVKGPREKLTLHDGRSLNNGISQLIYKHHAKNIEPTMESFFSLQECAIDSSYLAELGIPTSREEVADSSEASTTIQPSFPYITSGGDTAARYPAAWDGVLALGSTFQQAPEGSRYRPASVKDSDDGDSWEGLSLSNTSAAAPAPTRTESANNPTASPRLNREALGLRATWQTMSTATGSRQRQVRKIESTSVTRPRASRKKHTKRKQHVAVKNGQLQGGRTGTLHSRSRSRALPQPHQPGGKANDPSCELQVPVQQRQSSTIHEHPSCQPHAVFTSQAGPATAGPIVALSKDLPINDDKIRLQMDSLYNRVHSLVLRELKNMGFDAFASATVCLPSQGTLHDLYADFSAGDIECLHDIGLRTSVLELATALIGAYMKSDQVFGSRSLPSAQQYLQRAYNVLAKAGFERALAPYSTNLDTMLRRSWLFNIEEPEFAKTKLEALANNLAWDLGKVLHQHLSGKRDPADPDSAAAQAHLRMSEQLVSILTDALKLKCELLTDKVEYRFTWFPSGQPFEPAGMVATQGAGEKVLLTSFPGLVVTRPEGIVPICRARVNLLRVGEEN